jgi:hypothetical protein
VRNTATFLRPREIVPRHFPVMGLVAPRFGGDDVEDSPPMKRPCVVQRLHNGGFVRVQQLQPRVPRAVVSVPAQRFSTVPNSSTAQVANAKHANVQHSIMHRTHCSTIQVWIRNNDRRILPAVPT